ncbi:MAG: hypothetical protein IT335_05550, partial [Thermomicrobiales bacterium]|nr:hypothetical protein [Thermomicrobiales bacterium]
RYLPLLARYQGPVSPEQLIAAHIRTIYEARQLDDHWLEQAASEVSRMFKRDYDRLVPILEAIEPST